MENQNAKGIPANEINPEKDTNYKDDIMKTDFSVVTNNVHSDVTKNIKNDVTKSDVSNKNNLKQKWYRVNSTMIPVKLAYFCNGARRIGFAPNLALFLIAIGLNKEESGFIVGLG